MTSYEQSITGNLPTRLPDFESLERSVVNSSRSVFMFALLLVLAGLIAYENSFAGVFHFDDYPCIVTNHSLKSLADTWNATSDEIPGGLRRRTVGRWTFALNRSLHDLHLWGYHALNLAIHLAAGLLLMGVVRRTMRLPAMPAMIQQQSVVLAFCVALLWVVHPLQTESVTYIVQRLESLMGMFFLASLYGLVRGGSGGSSGWYGFAIAAALLSIGTKEVGLMIVPVALLYDRSFLATSWSEVRRKRAWVHGSILTAAMLYAVIGIGRVPFYVERPDAGVSRPDAEGRRASSWEYLRSQPGVLLHYFKLSFWPRDLCLDYVWQHARDPFEIYGKGAVIVGILATGLGLLWRFPAIAFLILSYFIILAPSSTIVPLHLAFEHRVYLSLAALICGVVLACFGLLARLRQKTQKTSQEATPPSSLARIDRESHSGRAKGEGANFLTEPRLGKQGEEAARFAAKGTLVLSIFAVIPLIWVTRERNKDYHSQVAMWSDVVRVSPHNSRGHMNLAVYAGSEGELDRAESHYRFALQIDPDYPQLQYNYAFFLVDHREQPELALPYFQRAIELTPGRALFYFGYGHALESAERFEEAEAAFRQGLELSPGDIIANLRLGQLLKNQERYEEAEPYLYRAAELGPYLWQPHRELGQIDAARGDFVAAIAHYQFAIDDPRSNIPRIFEDELAELRAELAEKEGVQ